MQKSILIGDDSLAIRKALRKVLEGEDSWVVVGEAENGKETIDKAQQLKPDLVVLDVSMPVMDGIQAARKLKRLLPKIPVVMFTNYADTNLHEIALSSGANAVVPKSEPGILVDRIHQLLEPVA